MPRHKPPLLLRYAVGTLFPALALLVILALEAVLQPDFPGHIASPLFLLAVVVSAWYGGKGSGLFTAGLSYLTLEYLFLPPLYDLQLGWEDVPLAGVYLLAAIGISTLEENRRRVEETVRKSEQRMHMARSVQARLCPVSAPDVVGFDIAGAFHPAEATGGDFYDFIPMRDGRIGIVIGDVSGHGFGSALLMAETRAYLRALAQTHENLGEILTLSNAMLAADTDDHYFVTLFIACIHPAYRSMVYAGAGHEAYLIHATGGRHRLRCTSLPLGVATDTVVPQVSGIVLDDGDVLFLFTDGILDAHSQRGEKFGIDRTIEAIIANRARPAREMLDRLSKTVRVFSGGMPQEDDMSAVIVRVNGPAIGAPAGAASRQQSSGSISSCTAQSPETRALAEPCRSQCAPT
jgi:serine phosphatase RsbU (regulator of sigma subunit)